MDPSYPSTFDDVVSTSDSLASNSPSPNTAADLAVLTDGLRTLDADQYELVTCGIKPLILCSAGPGSGKSHSLIHRVLHQLNHEPDLLPGDFICISFTNKSAGELRDRWHRLLLKADPDRKALGPLTPWISTIHRLGYHVLAQRLFSEATILSERRAQTLMRAIIEDRFPDKEARPEVTKIMETYDLLVAHAEFPLLINLRLRQDGSIEHITPECEGRNCEAYYPLTNSYLQNLAQDGTAPPAMTDELLRHIQTFYAHEAGVPIEVFQDLIIAYTKTKRQSNNFDYNDMLLLPVIYFARYPDATTVLRARYKHVLVDESQDLSPADLAMLRTVFDHDTNPDPYSEISGDVTRTSLTFIGDDKQSLFQFRGAFPRGLELLDQLFPKRELSVFKLTHNYRSTGSIVNLANRFADCFDRRFKWDSVPVIPPEKGCIQFKQFATVYDENSWLVRNIKESMAKPNPPASIAVLVRTNLSISNIEAALLSARIPYIAKSDAYSIGRSVGFNLYHAILSLWFNPVDQHSLLYLAGQLRGVGKVGIQQLRTSLLQYFSAVPDGNLTGFLHGKERQSKLMASVVGAYRKLVKLEDLPSITPTTNPDHFFNALDYLGRELTEETTSVKEGSLNRVRELIPHLHMFAINDPDFMSATPSEQARSIYTTFTLAATSGELDNEPDSNKLKVTLSTIHAFKGREADHIYYAHLNRLSPISKEDADAEACAFFVGVTRPQTKLWLSASDMIMSYDRRLVSSHPNPLLRHYLDGAKRGAS